MAENDYAVMHEDVYGLYRPDEKNDNKPRVLFLMREPGERYDKDNLYGNLIWWNEVCNGSKSTSYSQRMKNWLSYKFNVNNSDKLQDIEFAYIYYANIFPWGGGGKESDGCKEYVKGKTNVFDCIKMNGVTDSFNENDYEEAGESDNQTGALRIKKIIEKVEPDIIFTCINIYDLIAAVSEIEGEEDKVIEYPNQEPKRHSLRLFGKDRKKIDVYEVYHPSYSKKPIAKDNNA